MFKYEDDLNVIRLPSSTGDFHENSSLYAYDRASCLDFISSLDVPWHPEKGTPFFSVDFVFIGLRWDTVLKTVSLPEHKRLKFLDRVSSFISCFSKSPCKLRDVERIHGSLCYISFVYLEGRTYLPSLSNFACSFKGNTFISRYPTRSLLSDLKWWRNTLSLTSSPRQLTPLSDSLNLNIFVDASTSWGVGILLDGKWMAFKLRPQWNTSRIDNDVSRGICWLEMIAVELVIYAVQASGLSHCKILIHSDNMGVIGAVAKGRSPNYHINLSIRRMTDCTAAHFMLPLYRDRESSRNPAVPSARGNRPPSASHLPLSFVLPHDLDLAVGFFTYLSSHLFLIIGYGPRSY